MTTERYQPCRGCDEILPDAAFYWDKRTLPWKRRARCIRCMCATQIANNVKRQEERNVYDRQYKLKKKAKP